jgi:DNA polymerase III subunit epsilon
VSDNVRTIPGRWANGVLVGFDTETTGIDTETARIVSAAIVVDIPDGECQVRTWFLNPGVEIPLEATKVHGISTEMAIERGQSACEGIQEIVRYLDSILAERGPIPLVMVNAPFDLTILDREIQRHGLGSGLDLQFPVIDTLTCDRRLDTYSRHYTKPLSTL